MPTVQETLTAVVAADKAVADLKASSETAHKRAEAIDAQLADAERAAAAKHAEAVSHPEIPTGKLFRLTGSPDVLYSTGQKIEVSTPEELPGPTPATPSA